MYPSLSRNRWIEIDEDRHRQKQILYKDHLSSPLLSQPSPAQPSLACPSRAYPRGHGCMCIYFSIQARLGQERRGLIMLSIQAWPRQANTPAPPLPHERPPPSPPLWLHQTRHQTVSDKNRLDQNRLDQTRPDQIRPDQLGLDGQKKVDWTRPGLISSEREVEVEVTEDLPNLCPICS